MNIEKVEVYLDVNRILDAGADVVVRENKRFSGGGSIGDYCHVMTRSDDIVSRIKHELEWPLVNATEGHLTFLVSGKGADEVIESLRSLVSG